MGLINQYSDDCKVITNGLQVNYTRSKKFGNWVANSTTASTASVTYTECWEIRRFAKGTFKYVGLSYDAALECAEDMATKYTRTTKVSKWDTTGQSMYDPEFVDIDGGKIKMTDISINKTSGHLYEVIVNVNETDTRERRHIPASIETLFALENARDYSELESE